MHKRFPIIAGLLLAFVIGDTATKVLLSDGADRFSGEQKAMARYALIQARGWGLRGIQGIAALGLRVVSVEPIAESEPCEYILGTDMRRLHLSQDYRAVLQAWTIFGLPYARIAVTCNTVDWLGWL